MVVDGEKPAIVILLKVSARERGRQHELLLIFSIPMQYVAVSTTLSRIASGGESGLSFLMTIEKGRMETV